MSRKNKSVPIDERVGQEGINNQGEKIKIIAYRHAKDIDVEFEDGVVAENMAYSHFLEGKMKHPIRYEESFAYHIEVELGLNLKDIWNFEKNTLDPNKLPKQSNKKVWLYCQVHDYHNDNGGYPITCNHFYRGNRCAYCGPHKAHRLDSLGHLYPEIAQMIVNDERNNLTMEDTFNLRCKGGHYYFKCDKCSHGSSKKKSLNNIVNRGYSCEHCSEGISIPNKMLMQISKQLVWNLNFEFSPKWLHGQYGKCKLDGCDEAIKIGVEMDGNFYDNHKNERKEVDDWKDEQCLKNGIYVIRVDLMDLEQYKKNTFGYIKKQVLNSKLNLVYDLSSVDWELAWKNSQKSLVFEACKLWDDNKDMTTVDIANELGISKKTATDYLKRGYELNICDYTIEEGSKRAGKKRSGLNAYNSNVYEVIKPDGQSNILCGRQIYNNDSKGFLNISRETFNKYIEPFGDIDIARIKNDNKKTKLLIKIIEKLEPYDGYKFIRMNEK